VTQRECILCGLLDDRLPATWVAREESAAALLTPPDSALAPGHTLVIPTEHVVGVHEVEHSDLHSVMSLVRRVSLAMRSAIGATGVNILNASGPGSQQSIEHLHFHVVPRWEADGFSTWPTEHSNVSLVDIDVPEVLAMALHKP